MFGLDVKTLFDPKPVVSEIDKANRRILRKRIFEISKDAKASITTSDEPSEAGEPPHTRGERGQNIRSAVRYDAGPDDAISGPIFSMVGEVGRALEFGEEFHGEKYEARPLMFLALNRNVPAFGQDYSGAMN